MKKAFFIFLMLAIPAFSVGAQQRATVYELGPEAFTSHTRSNGYPWRAWGYVYPRGTFARPGSECQSPENRTPLGVWVIYGSTGGPAEYLGTVRVTIGRQSIYFNGLVMALDEDGFPLSSLFDVTGVGENARAELTPRSTQCFGGELKVFTD